MIAAWMVYCLAVGLAACIAGWCAERALYLTRRPTRLAWSVALLLTLLVPITALLRPQEFGCIRVPIAAPSLNPGNTIPIAAAPPLTRPLSWADLDGPLGWGWVLMSAGVLFAFGIASARLGRLQRQWRRVTVE